MLTHRDPKLIPLKSFLHKDDIKREQSEDEGTTNTHTKRDKKEKRVEKVGLGFDQRASGVSWHGCIF